MSVLFDHSPFKTYKKDKNLAFSSLSHFINSPLSQIPNKDLEKAKKIWKNIKKSHSRFFIFAFGGAGSTANILSSLYPSKNKNVYLITSLDKKSLDLLSFLTKTDLKSSYSFFFSNSGKTKEILFYKSFLKKLYKKNKLSLKESVTVLTHSLTNPLAKWAKKESCSIIISKNFLPGRFSFFTLSGFLQAEICNSPLNKKTIQHSTQLIKVLEFFTHYSNNKRKEIFFCPFTSSLKELACWWESTWSESLFREKKIIQTPLLRNINAPDLRHAFIEELITKKDTAWFWALDIQSENSINPYSHQIKKLLKAKKIPYLFMTCSMKNKDSINELIFTFYSILFCMGYILNLNIYIQPWVDYLKKR